MNKFKKLVNNEGFALVLTVILIIVIFTLGTVIIRITLAEYKQAEREKNRIKAYYLARAGAELVADAIIKEIIDPKVEFPEEGSAYVYDVRHNGEDIFDEIKVTPKSDNIYEIGSTANSNDVYRTIYLDIKHNFYPKFDHTIFTNAPLEIGPTNQVEIDTNDSSGIASTEEIILDDSQDEESLNPQPNETGYVFPEVYFPDDLTQKSDWNGEIINENSYQENVYYNTIDANSTELEVNTYGKEVNIYVNTLILKERLIINGGGIINFFITGDSEVKTPNAAFNVDQIFFFLKEGVNLQLIANSTTLGFIYGPRANVIMNSNDSFLNGAIISNVLNRSINIDKEFKGKITYVKPSAQALDNLKKYAKPYQKVEWRRD